MKRKYVKKNKTYKSNKNKIKNNKSIRKRYKSKKYSQRIFRTKKNLLKTVRKYKNSKKNRISKLHKKGKKTFKKHLGKKIFKGGSSVLSQVFPLELPNSIRGLIGGFKNSMNMLQGLPLNNSHISSPTKGHYQKNN